MIKELQTQEWCICKNANSAINVIRESRDKIELVNGEWQIKPEWASLKSSMLYVNNLNSYLFSILPKSCLPVEYSLIQQLNDSGDLDSLTVEEPIVLHFKTTIELTYTIE